MNLTKDQRCKHKIWVDGELYEDGRIRNVKACLGCGGTLDDI